MCQPGRPGPHGDGHSGSPGFAAFHSAKSSGLRFSSSTSTRARAFEEVFGATVRERAVVGQRRDLEVDALALDHVRAARGDQLGDQLLHLLDEVGRVRHVVGPQHVEPVELLPVGRLVGARELAFGRAPLVGPADDLVLDVGDVADVGDRVAPPLQVAPDHVERHRGAAVTDVRNVVDGRAADVHRHLARPARHELDLGARGGVEDPQHGLEATAGRRSATPVLRPLNPDRAGRPPRPRCPPTDRSRRRLRRVWASRARGCRSPIGSAADLQGGDQVGRHRVDVRRQPRLLGRDHHVDVGDPPSGRRAPAARRRGATRSTTRRATARRRRGTACRGRGGRPRRAPRRRPRGPPRRRRSARPEPGPAFEHDAAEHERTVAAERVHVVAQPHALTRAPCSRSCDLDQAGGDLEVVGHGDLQVARFTGDDPHDAARLLDEHRVVAAVGPPRARAATRRNGTPAESAPRPARRGARSRSPGRPRPASACRRPRGREPRRRHPRARQRSPPRTATATPAAAPRRARR